MIYNTLDLLDYLPQEIITTTGELIKLNVTTKNKLIFRRANGDILRAIIIPDKCLGVWYNVPQPKNSWYRFYYRIIPRYFPLDELTLQVFGLFKAELYKSYSGVKRAHSSQISFSNSEPILIKKVVEWFKRWFIGPTDWKWAVFLNKKFKMKDKPSEHLARIFAIQEFWKKEIGLSEEKMYPTPMFYVGRENGRISKFSTGWGTLKIEYGNVILRNIITTLIDKLTQEIEKSKGPKLISSYLSGIIAGEADITPKTHRVTIASAKTENRKHIKNCLQTLGIKPSKDTDTRIRIFNVKNMWLIFTHELMNLHPVKFSTFLYLLRTIKRFYKESKGVKRFIQDPKFQEFLNEETNRLKDLLDHRKETFHTMIENYLG